MSLHYEWTFSLRLRPDVPDAFLDELRYHPGVSDREPAVPSLDCAGRAFVSGYGEDVLPGGPVARPVRQKHGSMPESWGLFVRTFVLDDEMYELVQVVPPWLARCSWTEGWIGFAREELGLGTWLDFYAARGTGEPPWRGSASDEAVSREVGRLGRYRE